jgi:hypothetical protein
MQKAIIIIIVLIVAIGGYLGWDWYAKTSKQALEPSITLYYWTDARGNKHFSDSPPPEDAKDVYTDKGYKHIKPPLVVTIKDKTIEFYKETKKKLFKTKKNRKNK